ncbi:MAG: ABC transporter permease [Sphaerochaetaceae bacterium]|nr:FtsX-like permease family protein [Sphaerochaetaceae bacterium]HHU88981.1 ABC transporter permease [Spirochaetales bacterium]
MFSSWLFSHLLFPSKELIYQRRRLLRSALLIALVMIPLVLALIFMDGMMQGITDKYILLQDGHLQFYNLDELDDPLVQSSDLVTSGYGIIYSRDKSAEVKLKGVKEDYFNSQRCAELKIKEFKAESTGSVAQIMVSETLLKELNVEVGERVAFILIPEGEQKGVRPMLAQVATTYNTGYYELDSSLIFLNYEVAKRYLPNGGRSYLEVLVDNRGSGHLDELGERLAKGGSWASWDQFNRTVYQNFVTSRQVILLVFILILVVAGVYVASVSNELIQDSFQAIALFKALGAQQKSIRRSYFWAVMVVTILGIALGLVVALVLGHYLSPILVWLSKQGFEGLRYYLLDFKVVVAYTDLLFIVGSMVIIASVTVMFTLKRIKEISPLEVLQQD